MFQIVELTLLRMVVSLKVRFAERSLQPRTVLINTRTYMIRYINVKLVLNVLVVRVSLIGILELIQERNLMNVLYVVKDLHEKKT